MALNNPVRALLYKGPKLEFTNIYPQKLALTSPTGGGRSVGIVRVRTKATEFFIIRKLVYDT